MDVKQYGPALFPTVKQVRRILDENAGIPAHRRHDAPQDGPSSGNVGSDSPRGIE